MLGEPLEEGLPDGSGNGGDAPVYREIEVLLEHCADGVAGMDAAYGFSEQGRNGDYFEPRETLLFRYRQGVGDDELGDATIGETLMGISGEDGVSGTAIHAGRAVCI